MSDQPVPARIVISNNVFEGSGAFNADSGDPMVEIAQERSEAQAALAEAEQLMKDGARDPAAFRKAKRDRDAAVEALERLEWAEKAERDRQAGAALQAKRDALGEAQARAREALKRAAWLSSDLEQSVRTVVEKVKALQAAQTDVDRGVHFEGFGVRDGYLDRQTLAPQLPVSPELPVTLLRAGRELAKVAGMSIPVAETKAAQGKL